MLHIPVQTPSQFVDLFFNKLFTDIEKNVVKIVQVTLVFRPGTKLPIRAELLTNKYTLHIHLQTVPAGLVLTLITDKGELGMLASTNDYIDTMKLFVRYHKKLLNLAKQRLISTLKGEYEVVDDMFGVRVDGKIIKYADRIGNDIFSTYFIYFY